MQYLGGGKGERENGNVVLLTVSFGCTCNLVGRLGGDRLSSIEAIEFALHILRFDNTIGEESKMVVRCERESCLGVFGCRADTQR